MPGRKYDDEELRNLWDLAMEQGRDQLEPGERIAVSRWCRRTGHDIPRDVPSESTGPVPVGGDRAAGDGSAGQRRDVDAGVVPSEPVEEAPVGMDRHRGGVADEDLREVERLRSIRFVDRFPTTSSPIGPSVGRAWPTRCGISCRSPRSSPRACLGGAPWT